jgi:hypothetical protein
LDYAGDWCPEGDSNTQRMVSRTIVSTVGLPGHGAPCWLRSSVTALPKLCSAIEPTEQNPELPGRNRTPGVDLARIATTDPGQQGAGWLNQTAASALRGERSVTELSQQIAFSKAGDRPPRDHQASGRLIHVVCQQNIRLSMGISGVSNPSVLALCLFRQRLDLGRFTPNCARIRASYS